jgi:excisionase family DNA binding protein
MENEWLTVQGAAEELNCSTKTIRNYIKSGRLEAERVGPKLIAINIDSLDRVRVPILPSQRKLVTR